MRILLMDRELRSQCRSQDKGKVKSVFDDMDPLKTHSKRIVILHPKVPFLRAFLPVTQPCLRVSFSRAQYAGSPLTLREILLLRIVLRNLHPCSSRTSVVPVSVLSVIPPVGGFLRPPSFESFVAPSAFSFL
jgi:hypothetical protein